jgi:YD repeat-containing protein
MFARSVAVCLVGGFIGVATIAHSQLDSAADSVRVTVSMNADGSKTVYEFDSVHHKAKATTTGKDGKLAGRILYVLDDAGRFASGEVYGPDDQFRFRTLYKYDDAGRLSREIQLGQDDVVRNKIVYTYDKNGRQTGYTVYDAADKVVRITGGTSPTPSPTPRRKSNYAR